MKEVGLPWMVLAFAFGGGLGWLTAYQPAARTVEIEAPECQRLVDSGGGWLRYRPYEWGEGPENWTINGPKQTLVVRERCDRSRWAPAR